MKKRLQKILKVLSHGLIERETPLKLALLSSLAGEHFLLLGAHGTAKSVLAHKLHLAYKDGGYFERLLTRFSVPEELFGPLSIKALENDRYERLTDRYLPTATIAFIDEIFKANSAILNSLLTILNEREFDNGDARIRVPLVSVIGASNELPEEDGLAALYDRFLCRYQVQPVSDEQFEALLNLDDSETEKLDASLKLTAETIAEIQKKASALPLSPEVIELISALRRHFQNEGIYISDRRWRKVVKLLKVAASSNGQDAVSIWDCWLLQHCLWDSPEQRMAILEWFQAHVGLGSGFNPERLNKLVLTWEKLLAEDSSSKIQRRNEDNRPLYFTQQHKETTQQSFKKWLKRNEEPLYLSPPDQEDRSNENRGYTAEELLKQFFDDRYHQCHIDGKWQHIDQYLSERSNRLVVVESNSPIMEPQQHEAHFLKAREGEISTLRNSIRQFHKSLQQQLDSLDRTIGEHLWLDLDFTETAQSSLKASILLAEKFDERLKKVCAEYSALPKVEAQT